MNIYSAPTADFTHVDSKDATYEPRMFELKGRIGRVRYLAYYFALTFLTSIFAGVMVVLFPTSILAIVIGYVPVLAAALILTVRRLHDMDHNGWLAALLLVPLVNAFFGLWLLFGRGTDGHNSYGPPPSANTRSVVVLAWIVPAIFLIGIVAAVAIPAYSAYVNKTRAAQGAALTTPSQVAAYSAPLSLMSI